MSLDLTGWDIKAIYDSDQPDLLESEAFYIAFARMHNIDGHKLLCVLAKPKAIKASYGYGLEEGIVSDAVLIIRKDEAPNVRLNSSMRIDSRLYVIVSVSNPIGDIIRMDLLSRE